VGIGSIKNKAAEAFKKVAEELTPKRVPYEKQLADLKGRLAELDKQGWGAPASVKLERASLKLSIAQLENQHNVLKNLR
jgi:hypothetical protein